MKSKIKIPKVLFVMDTPWKIVFKKRIGQGGIMGMCDPERHEIIILKGLNENDLLSTLIHEVLHAIEYGLGKSIGHSLVYKLEAPLASVMVQVMGAVKANKRL